MQDPDGAATDKAALIALFEATDGTNWTTGTNWKSDEDLGAWHGVTTGSDGRVTALALKENGLDGTLPDALGDLSELEGLDLRENNLRGALPSALTSLGSLASLRLSRNWALAGAVPDRLRELADLDTLAIDNTELCAPRDAAFRTWLETISFNGLICPPSEQSVIDVAVFFTPQARAGAGGTDQIKASIDLMTAETNGAFRDSDANLRMRLVAVEEIAYRRGNLRENMQRLVGKQDGHMDEVHDVRNNVAADIVLLVLPSHTGAANYIPTPRHSSEAKAFALAGPPGASATFAHELGHLLGLSHDRFWLCNYSECADVHGALGFPYSVGYLNQRAFDEGAPKSARWRSIMALATQCRWVSLSFSCPTLLRFSNPEQSHLGDPLGTSGVQPDPGVGGPAELAPVSWTLHPCRRRYPRCRERGAGTRQRTDNRWWIWSGPGAARTI